jgi:hypothetical protein
MRIVCIIHKYTSDGAAVSTAESSILKLLFHYKLDVFAMRHTEVLRGVESGD